MHGLHELGIKEETLSRFMRLHIHPTDDTYALDIRHSSIIVSNLTITYLNITYLIMMCMKESVFFL